ncbi:hypothetical protein K2173_026875 [Erythroxylum novogranatense]|uniref:RING-type domain-containing protein n=1 Tax=Erythroxylum novogranatense TaxID=1862640 RepID=A0AAV8TZZ7_9ROSI|nr:hypothetical protein K2173_026875 [Erythroxylum novogranatense]
MWDCRLQSDGLPCGSNGFASLTSNSRGSGSCLGSGRFTNHHHSVSDVTLSYSDSPTANIQEQCQTSPLPMYDLGEPSASRVRGQFYSSGSQCQGGWFHSSAESEFTVRPSLGSPSFKSPSSLSEFGHVESVSKRPLIFSSRNLAARHSFMSKSVYPLVFQNPVSECETFGDTSNIDRLTPVGDRTSPSFWPGNSSSGDFKVHSTLTELQKLETSPEPGASSRKDGFRWSSASSSYDMGLDGERFDLAGEVGMENGRSPSASVADPKCGVCRKLLWQKSPWSSHRIMRGGDMPTAGVLACSHVFHAECLEQATPKTQIHDPPCPSCLNSIGEIEEYPSVSEPLQMALKSIRRNRQFVISDSHGTHNGNEVPTNVKDGSRSNWHLMISQTSNSSSSLTNRLKRHFTFKGKTRKEIFGTKAFQRIIF